jgi:hypothetical protein
MARVQLGFYRDGTEVPVYEWLLAQPKVVEARAILMLERLEAPGHELRRPHADHLGEGIYELRFRVGKVN